MTALSKRTQDFCRRASVQSGIDLTGSDAALPGIMGALMGGVLTAGRLIGPPGFFQIWRRRFYVALAAALFTLLALFGDLCQQDVKRLSILTLRRPTPGGSFVA